MSVKVNRPALHAMGSATESSQVSQRDDEAAPRAGAGEHLARRGSSTSFLLSLPVMAIVSSFFSPRLRIINLSLLLNGSGYDERLLAARMDPLTQPAGSRKPCRPPRGYGGGEGLCVDSNALSS